MTSSIKSKDLQLSVRVKGSHDPQGLQFFPSELAQAPTGPVTTSAPTGLQRMPVIIQVWADSQLKAVLEYQHLFKEIEVEA
jgi:hypothetical protein